MFGKRGSENESMMTGKNTHSAHSLMRGVSVHRLITLSEWLERAKCFGKVQTFLKGGRLQAFSFSVYAPIKCHSIKPTLIRRISGNPPWRNRIAPSGKLRRGRNFPRAAPDNPPPLRRRPEVSASPFARSG